VVPRLFVAPMGISVRKHTMDMCAASYTRRQMARDEKLEHLRTVPLFAHMGRSELQRLGQLTDEIEVGLDRVVAEQGEIGHEFFFVLDGRLMVLDGHRPIATMGPGDFFGEIALLDGRPRTATVRAEGITRLLVIGHREFHALMDEFPSVRTAVLDAVAERLRRTEGE
jgi:CRP/FNR family transcriptional regulator, cyclic AMP receptor protein